MFFCPLFLLVRFILRRKTLPSTLAKRRNGFLMSALSNPVYSNLERGEGMRKVWTVLTRTVFTTPMGTQDSGERLSTSAKKRVRTERARDPSIRVLKYVECELGDHHHRQASYRSETRPPPSVPSFVSSRAGNEREGRSRD